MKVLITGARGFVGQHLVPALRRELKDGAEICPTSREACVDPLLGETQALDVTDQAAVNSAIDRIRPNHVVHLAGVAAIPAASSNADATWLLHLQGTLNIANAILAIVPACCLHFVGSGQVYGTSARSGQPLDESTLLQPNNDYAASKAAADLAVGALVHKGLKCVRLRPFNHTGPGQSEAFVVPDFAMQVARVKAGLQPRTILVGNLDMQRDFLDVRDVVRAYVLAIVRSEALEAGVVLNIASGVPRRVRSILDQLVALSGAEIRIQPDQERMRARDVSCFVGNASRARELLGWQPAYDFSSTLADVLADCQQRVASGVA